VPAHRINPHSISRCLLLSCQRQGNCFSLFMHREQLLSQLNGRVCIQWHKQRLSMAIICHLTTRTNFVRCCSTHLLLGHLPQVLLLRKGLQQQLSTYTSLTHAKPQRPSMPLQIHAYMVYNVLLKLVRSLRCHTELTHSSSHRYHERNMMQVHSFASDQ